ncbi:hypothetical protein [Streptomyces prunicolor]|uniref:hypothetical protein n=1 Tax=Streptomyces prunicolor TaxID=67348 RepID=UPI0003772CAB|nr:hypothetical protein [Streptomyces prunicolor]
MSQPIKPRRRVRHDHTDRTAAQDRLHSALQDLRESGLGAVPLATLTPDHVRRWLDEARRG